MWSNFLRAALDSWPLCFAHILRRQSRPPQLHLSLGGCLPVRIGWRQRFRRRHWYRLSGSCRGGCPVAAAVPAAAAVFFLCRVGLLEPDARGWLGRAPPNGAGTRGCLFSFGFVAISASKESELKCSRGGEAWVALDEEAEYPDEERSLSETRTAEIGCAAMGSGRSPSSSTLLLDPC